MGKLGFSSRNELRKWDGIAKESALQVSQEAKEFAGIGSIGQIARTVSDIKAAEDWYRDVLRLRHLFSAGTMGFFNCDGIRLMLSEGEAGPESILYFTVEDIHAACKDLVEKGANILSAPHKLHTYQDVTEEWMCFFEDNEKRPLAFMATARPFAG